MTTRRMPEQKPGRSVQVVGTPLVFTTRVLQLLGIRDFDVDLAATQYNRKTDRWFGPGHLTHPDAFQVSWAQGTGWNWLNPPYTDIEPWVRRAYEENLRAAWEEPERGRTAKTAVLVPASTGSNWWRDWVHHKARVILLNGRLTFEGHDKPYPKDCALLLYGHPATSYGVWNWKHTLEVN